MLLSREMLLLREMLLSREILLSREMLLSNNREMLKPSLRVRGYWLQGFESSRIASSDPTVLSDLPILELLGAFFLVGFCVLPVDSHFEPCPWIFIPPLPRTPVLPKVRSATKQDCKENVIQVNSPNPSPAKILKALIKWV
jgi:hypothetical protein